MSKFNLEWFKANQKLVELEIKKVELEKEMIEFELNNSQIPLHSPAPLGTIVSSTSTYIIPYSNIKLVNDVLTIVLYDGSILTKSNANAEDFKNARISKTIDDLLEIVLDPQILAEKNRAKEEYEKAKAIRKGVELLGSLDDFEIKGDSVYLTGINRSLPQLLVEEFAEIVTDYDEGWYEGSLQDALNEDEEFQALKRFFMWCCLNPRAEVAHELYRFLVDNSFRITKQGFFVALRNVVTVHGGVEFVNFVSNTYTKVKAVWKKNPSKYHVILNNGEYSLLHEDDLFTSETVECDNCEGTGEVWDDVYEEDLDCEECNGAGTCTYTNKTYLGEDIGVLTDLYLDLPNRDENRFTDDWTKTFDIRIGKPVSMPMTDCNWSTQDCAAAGLHFTSDQIHYVGCGDTSVLVLINPMKVVGIGQHKGRCYEYLPIMTVPREEATTILHDNAFDTLQLDDAYAIRELEDLSNKVKEGFAIEAQKYSFNIPCINNFEVEQITQSLDSMLVELSKRVKIVE